MKNTQVPEPPPFGALPIDTFFKIIRRQYMAAQERNGGEPPIVRVTAHGPYLEMTIDPQNYKPGPFVEALKAF